jgi:LacI family transcriptional regulator
MKIPRPSGTRQPTLRAVAHEAGVSVMTVSNVVNERFDMMSADTRARVEDAVARLGYRRDVSARGLRLARRFTVGVILVDPSPIFMADPFITQVVAGLCNVLGARGFSVTIAGTSAERLDDVVFLRSSATDALCVMLSGPPAVRKRCLRTIARAKQPTVVIQEDCRADGEHVCSVRQDDEGGGEALGKRILAKGARQLVILVPSLPWPAVQSRARGIRKAAARFRNARVAVVECGDEQFLTTQTALDRHVALHGLPDAIMGANDQMGIAALKWLRTRGLDVPRDVLLTGFNAFAFWQYSDPVLTTVRSPAYELGEASGREVLAHLARGRFDAADTVLPVTLVPGATG